MLSIVFRLTVPALRFAIGKLRPRALELSLDSIQLALGCGQLRLDLLTLDCQLLASCSNLS